MLDRAARSTIRNFSTLFLVCLVVFLPLEMTYAFLHRDAIEVRELTPFITELEQGQRVNGVGADELDAAERDRQILTVIELALVPLMISAGRRVLERDAGREIPTATDAYKHAFTPPRIGPIPGPSSLGALGLSIVFSLLVGFAVYKAGGLVLDVFPDRFDFVILGTVEACARSVGLPWFLVTWIETARSRERRVRPSAPGSPFARPPGRRQGKL